MDEQKWSKYGVNRGNYSTTITPSYFDWVARELIVLLGEIINNQGDYPLQFQVVVININVFELTSKW